jgi:hypothetical protein
MKPESPLLGCFAKIEWAETEIDNLKTEIETLFRANPHTISAKLDANGIEVSRLEAPSIPSRFNVFAGKILASFREPFDQMLTALAEHSGKSSAGIQFPFGETIDRFKVPDRGSVNPTPLGGLGQRHFAA